jgi:acetyl-CoA carboxylase carboxyl transferase subunit beta
MRFSTGRAERRRGRRGDSWIRCPRCAEIQPAADLQAHHGVCPACAHHHPLELDARLSLLCDADSFRSEDQGLAAEDVLRFKGERRYKDRLAQLRKGGGADEAVRAGRARLEGRPLVLAAVESGFLWGSLGCVAGERLVRAFGRAAGDGLPLVLVLSGGAPRYAEGIAAGIQLARIADQRAALYGAGVPYLALLVPPLPRQGLLSLALSADVALAEPADAPAGEPDGLSGAALLEAGLVDRLVPRDRLKAELTHLLNLLLPD